MFTKIRIEAHHPCEATSTYILALQITSKKFVTPRNLKIPITQPSPMDLNVVILTLQYSYLLSSRAALHESNSGLWQNHDECTQTLLPYMSKCQNVRIIDNMARLRETSMMLNHNGIGEENHIKLIEPQVNNQLITVSINGNETFINNSRNEILRAYHQVDFRQIALTGAQMESIDSTFIQRLDSIANRHKVEVLIDNLDTDFASSVQISDTTSIFVLGPMDDLTAAETEIRVLVDAALDGCLVDRISLPLSLIPTLGGSKLANFSEIASQLNVNIYLPYLMPHVFHSTSSDCNESMSIWLTSKSIPEIVFAKNILTNLISAVDPRVDKENKLFIQEIEIPKDKLDLISLYHHNSILSTMLKYGTFIQIPSLGEARNNKMIVQGHSEEAVQGTAQELSALSTQFYSLDIKFSRGPTSADFEYYLISLINTKKTCVLTYNKNGMNIVGSKEEIKILLDELVSDLQSSIFFTSLVNESETKFQMVLSMELNNQHKEFLSGKKNGKIIKILNQLSHIPTIKFKYLNDFNFLVNTSIRVGAGIKNKQVLTVFSLLVKSVNLVEMELPAELRFNVPEVFHKSIIGNGGSIIQSIMKKYNVFIKFSSASHLSKKRVGEEKQDKMLYMFKRNDNVLIKCPMKNLKNILFVKYELDQLVNQCIQNKCPPLNGIAASYFSVGFKLFRSHYLMLKQKQNFDLSFVCGLESEFNTYIEFPKSLQDFNGQSSVDISIKGNDLKAKQCAQKLAEMLPSSYEFQVTYCPGKFDELINEHNLEFRERVIIPFELILETELVTSLVSGPVDQGSPAFHQIILSSYDTSKLKRAVSELTSYLRERKFLILEKQDLKFEPITFVEADEVALSPSNVSRSPTRSPARSPTRSPQKKALKLITNQLSQGGKKSPLASGPNFKAPIAAMPIPDLGVGKFAA